MDKGTEQILKKRFQTTMIGALFEFEKSFGHLWAQDKDQDEPLTKSEERFLDLWEETRNRILNNGNNQFRKALSEISKQTNSNTYKFHIRER